MLCNVPVERALQVGHGLGLFFGVTNSSSFWPEWYVDIWLTIVWVVYLLIFLCTLAKRKEPHIYVANWFYLAFIITVAILHLVNNLALPVGFYEIKSYSLFSGVQDAMTQWWYGHNAVGFFLTAGFLAIMYYFIPKRAERPVWSYKLSIVHFWAVIFIYIWAGPHQWDKLRTDPVLRMLVVSVAFYGMATFEGPLMSVRYVNALSHYTDWTIGHVHSGALGWNGFITFGALYCLVPWLWKKKALYSNRLVEWHFWLATIGILFYITSMWVSGIMEGLMWRAYTSQGFLEYAFIETVSAKHVSYAVRALGGSLFLIGTFIMAFNLRMTVLGRGDAVAIEGDTPVVQKPVLPAADDAVPAIGE